jgi:type IV secretion system protein VirB4
LKGRARALIPADPKIYAHLPYVIELDDEVVRTRDNALMISLEVTGHRRRHIGSSAVTALGPGSRISSTRWTSGSASICTG